MENNNDNIETILINKIKQFSTYLISICNCNNSKQMIEDKMMNLKLYEILLFISFLNQQKLNDEISLLFKQFNLIDNEENRKNVLDYINYFIKIKYIIAK